MALATTITTREKDNAWETPTTSLQYISPTRANDKLQG